MKQWPKLLAAGLAHSENKNFFSDRVSHYGSTANAHLQHPAFPSVFQLNTVRYIPVQVILRWIAVVALRTLAL
jgi:hypothetical protein